MTAPSLQLSSRPSTINIPKPSTIDNIRNDGINQGGTATITVTGRRYMHTQSPKLTKSKSDFQQGQLVCQKSLHWYSHWIIINYGALIDQRVVINGICKQQQSVKKRVRNIYKIISWHRCRTFIPLNTITTIGPRTMLSKYGSEMSRPRSAPKDFITDEHIAAQELLDLNVIYSPCNSLKVISGNYNGSSLK